MCLCLRIGFYNDNVMKCYNISTLSLKDILSIIVTISVPLQALFVFTGNSTDFLKTLLFLYNTVQCTVYTFSIQSTVANLVDIYQFCYFFYVGPVFSSKINDPPKFPSVHCKPSYQAFWLVWLINRIRMIWD